MHAEIETRFLEIDKEGLIQKLMTLGAADKGEEKLDEIIFHDKALTWHNKNTFVRLRKKKDDITLTYKTNMAQQVDSAREIEFQVSDLEDAKAFLEAVGLVAYRVLEKYRHTLVLDGVTFDIDTWPKIPPYVELEADSVEALQQAAEKVGLVWGDRFDGDARQVYKHYGYDIDPMRTITFDVFE